MASEKRFLFINLKLTKVNKPQKHIFEADISNIVPLSKLCDKGLMEKKVYQCQLYKISIAVNLPFRA